MNVKKTLSQVTFLFLGLLFVEFFLRSFSPVYLQGIPGAYQFDRELGVRLKEGAHFLKTLDYQQEVYTNQKGTVNFQNSFRGYEKLIFTLGDSYTQGVGLPADANYPFQLDLLLNLENGRYTKKYGVVNLGLAAFGGKQSILALMRYQEIIGKPAYIFYLASSNDYEDDLLFLSGYRHKHLVEGSPRWGIFLKPLQWFSNETEIGKRFKIAIGFFRRKVYKSRHRQEKFEDKTSNAAALEEPILKELLQIAKDLDATLVVSWADVPKGSLESYEWLKKWAQASHVAFADWYPIAESVRSAMPNLPLENPHSGGHYRTWVSSLIAKSFADHIRR